MRVQFLILGLLSHQAHAEVWQISPDLGLKAADVQLSSSDSESRKEKQVRSQRSGLHLLREDKDSQWMTSARIESSESDQTPYGEASLKSRYQSKERLSETSYEVALQRSRGADPLNPIIEKAVAEDDQDFQSILAGVYRQLSIDVANDVAVYVGGGENRDGASKIEARDAQLSWDHHHSVLWTSRLLARYAEAGTLQKEIKQEHQVRISPKLSTELSYGYGWQAVENSQGGRSEGALWGASLLYRTNGLGNSQSAYQSVAPVRELTEEQTASMRGSSLYAIGWTHSRDRRRVGDPYYYADIVYASTAIELSTNQTFEAKGSRSGSTRQRLIEDTGAYRSQLLQGTYTLRHRFWNRYPDAALTVGYTSEHTEFSLQRLARESYALSYALAW